MKGVGALIDIFVSLGSLNLLPSPLPPPVFLGIQNCVIVHKGRLKLRVLMTYLGFMTRKILEPLTPEPSGVIIIYI